MAITDKQVDEMCRKLAISFGVATTDDLVKEMVNRFLNWKLPSDFHPDAGIRFDPEYNVEYMAKQGKPPSIHEPQGTNLFHAGQAEEMVRYMLGLPNIEGLADGAMSEQTIILTGTVQRESAHKRIDGLPLDGSMEVAFRPRKRARSPSQNALMWGARLKEISEQAWVAGKQFSADTWHEFLKREYLPEGNEEDFARLVKNPDTYRKWDWLPNGERRLAGSTTELTTLGMTRYMEQVEAYCAQELGVQFSSERLAA